MRRGAPTPAGGGRRSTKPTDAGTERGRAEPSSAPGREEAEPRWGCCEARLSRSLCVTAARSLWLCIRGPAPGAPIPSARSLTTSALSARPQSPPLAALSARSSSAPQRPLREAPSPGKLLPGSPEGVASLLRPALQCKSGTLPGSAFKTHCSFHMRASSGLRKPVPEAPLPGGWEEIPAHLETRPPVSRQAVRTAMGKANGVD